MLHLILRNLLCDTYPMHLQLSQYDGLGDSQRPSWFCLEDLYELCFLGRGEERIRPPLENRADASANFSKGHIRSTIKACSQGHPSHTAPLARLYVPYTARAQIPQRRQKSHPHCLRGHTSMRGYQAGVGERQPGRCLARFRVSRATCSRHLSSFLFF